MDKKIKKIILEIEKRLGAILSSLKLTYGIKKSIRNLLKEIVIFQAYLNSFDANKSETIKKDHVQIGGGAHYLQG